MPLQIYALRAGTGTKIDKITLRSVLEPRIELDRLARLDDMVAIAMPLATACLGERSQLTFAVDGGKTVTIENFIKYAEIRCAVAQVSIVIIRSLAVRRRHRYSVR